MMTTQNKGISTNGKYSLIAGTLFVSAILNLFLVGVLAGIVPSTKCKSFLPLTLSSSHSEYLVDWMTRYLDQSDAAIFRDVVKSQTPALKQGHDQVHQATKDVAIVFEQDPPDQEALQAALDHLAETKASVDNTVKDVVLDAYIKLSPDGRHRLAELTR